MTRILRAFPFSRTSLVRLPKRDSPRKLDFLKRMRVSCSCQGVIALRYRTLRPRRHSRSLMDRSLMTASKVSENQLLAYLSAKVSLSL